MMPARAGISSTSPPVKGRSAQVARPARIRKTPTARLSKPPSVCWSAPLQRGQCGTGSPASGEAELPFSHGPSGSGPPAAVPLCISVTGPASHKKTCVFRQARCCRFRPAQKALQAGLRGSQGFPMQLTKNTCAQTLRAPQALCQDQRRFLHHESPVLRNWVCIEFIA